MSKRKKWLALCCALMALWLGMGSCLAEDESSRFVYGYSELGRELACYAVGNQQAETSLLMVFGVHGFEDAFDHDGEVLKLIAEQVLAHYSEPSASALPFRLYVIPVANPDGLLDGTSQNGFGRCNANGIDINRDFSVGWSRQSYDRIQTGKAPFATAEARAIRDLVETIQPDYAIDVHGWCERAFGNGKMARYFAKPFDFETQRFYGGGMLYAWLNAHTQESVLLELPPDPNKDSYVTDTAEKLIEGVDAWMAYCCGQTR